MPSIQKALVNSSNVLKLLRPKHYVKNLFIFMPLFFAGEFSNFQLLFNLFIAFLSFSMCASAIYIFNDYQDIKEDRLHPKKKFRPLAAGTVSTPEAIFLMILLLAAGLLIMGMLSINALGIMGSYLVLNFFYCYYFKHISILDITVIAVGFVLRIILGAVITDTPLSQWIVIMTFLLALFLAFAKRRDGVLLFLEKNHKMRKVITDYNLKFVEGSMMIMSSVTIVTYILYTTSAEVVGRLESKFVYLTSIYVILGILRYMQLSFVEKNSGSPTDLVFKDSFLITVLSGWILHFSVLIYF
ncbi:decaprenyl-phosphate phosphoribosyltransferase [Arenibacter sp. BSSL-BM3]|uniref:Decaprenyl-phosphate phosphoribosyltransferase n=1 Tax=Arenibacter arenosicollis TaxID=2762274 RepID=A0ABR7QRQ0_9FLAO|nr:decaprenyl-phosphate phosphoribosyltransferase [Arenibacter arenosicollis]MBC8769838.1 decaprenyl-phosphate phosphoribosyltransferase [Arenibacter arenosicollis]